MKGLRKDNGGQIVIALAIIIPFIILQLAFLVNVSLLVHQKVKLQNAVDAGVYSASASFARDLNYIAELNFNIDQIWHGSEPSDANLFNSGWEQSFEDYVEDTSYNEEQMAIALFNRYENDYSEIMDEIGWVNETAFARAITSGEKAARQTYYNGNAEYTASNPSNITFQSLFDSSTQGEGFMDYQEHMSDEYSIGYVITSGDCNAVFDACAGYASITRKVHIPINKLNQIAFAGKATAKPGFSPLASSRFNVDPWRLTAYAKGQPYGGSVEGLSGSYGAALIPVGDIDGKTLYH